MYLQGVRGRTFHLLIVDEHLFVKEPTLKTMLPIFQKERIGILFISTLKPGHTPPVQAMFDSVFDTGKRVIPLLEIVVTCKRPECEQSIQLSGACIHMRNQKPSFMTQQNIQWISELNKNSSDVRSGLMEQYGIGYDSDARVFSAASIQRIFDNPVYVKASTIKQVYIFVDPHNGGRSHLALSVVGFWQGQMVLFGGYAANCTLGKEYEVLAHTVVAVKTHPALQGVPVYVVQEANLQGNNMLLYNTYHENVAGTTRTVNCTIKEDGKRRRVTRKVGMNVYWYVTVQNRRNFVEHNPYVDPSELNRNGVRLGIFNARGSKEVWTARLLALLRDDAVHRVHDMVCVTSETTPDFAAYPIAQYISDAKTQLANWSAIHKARPDGSITTIFSGKYGANGQEISESLNDDLAITILLAAYFGHAQEATFHYTM